jgi:hypothetical protein
MEENESISKYIDDTMFLYTEDSIILILDKNISLKDLKKIEYSKKYISFLFKNKEKKLLIPKINVVKDLISIPNIYLMDQVDFLAKVFVIKKDQILF